MEERSLRNYDIRKDGERGLNFVVEFMKERGKDFCMEDGEPMLVEGWLEN